MSVKKQYLKNKDICKVTFRISAEEGKPYQTVSLVGDFNNWDSEANIMTKLKRDGSFSFTNLELETGKSYSFKYLCDGKIWLTEKEADKQEVNEFGTENSVLVI